MSSKINCVNKGFDVLCKNLNRTENDTGFGSSFIIWLGLFVAH